jgi:hypothetical protein
MTTRAEKLTKVKELQAQLDLIREDLGVSAKGAEVVNDEVWDDRRLVVTADGLGGATLEYVEGHYPIDYESLNERQYDDENDACHDCARLVSNYQNDGSDLEEDEDKDWDDLIEEIFKKAKNRRNR